MIAKTAYLEEKARQYDAERFTTPAGRALHEIEFALLREALSRQQRDARVVEVGCGTGRLLLEVRALGLRCEGVDASPDMVAEVRRKLGDAAAEVPLHVAEGKSLPFRDGEFDFAYSIRVLNQVASPEYALAMTAEILRIVRPGGTALIEFSNRARPRIGTWTGVRLAPRDIIAAAAAAGGDLVAVRGAFFLGMLAQLKCPDALRPVLTAADGALSRLLPRLCARVYLELRKCG
jgi:SAM-dependent methyltransferase